eukprot:gnl/TRDRNA2_/TRDRNA2_183756_c0_seq1.p1 gnl/TRDRNA2_/TRDRNA2_183756_c0~~gnl/TRDRNA2_/TRDRNA2_183756_c0_seq1.p1  ORF type:complete len:580 (-),score=86.22 gnl/TRDRNA2_/TRDRNA2_183756_c0_seq1:215-1954(-)
MAHAMSGTMEDFKVPGNSWAQDLKSYEREKRRVVDEGLLRGPQVRVVNGMVKAQERVFDPVLQRYRDNQTELNQRRSEEKERVGHLNRAMDIQILREQPFHIINHASKIEAIYPDQDPMKVGKNKRKKEGRSGSFPTTTLDYNILSNLPMDVHHWAKPEDRPHCAERIGKQRQVPNFLVKDYNIVTNRYLDDHEEKITRDKDLNLLEATQKYMKSNRLDPVTQQFADPRNEVRVRAAEDAREVEITMRYEAAHPPCYKGRTTAHYDMLSHHVHNKGMLDALEAAEEERTERYRNRYIVEHNLHAQDIKGDHVEHSRKINRVAHERYEEDKRRGFDIVTNTEYGRGPKCKTFHDPYTKKRLTPWERVQASNRAASVPPGGRSSSRMEEPPRSQSQADDYSRSAGPSPSPVPPMPGEQSAVQELPPRAASSQSRHQEAAAVSSRQPSRPPRGPTPSGQRQEGPPSRAPSVASRAPSVTDYDKTRVQSPYPGNPDDWRSSHGHLAIPGGPMDEPPTRYNNGHPLHKRPLPEPKRTELSCGHPSYGATMSNPAATRGYMPPPAPAAVPGSPAGGGSVYSRQKT